MIIMLLVKGNILKLFDHPFLLSGVIIIILFQSLILYYFLCTSMSFSNTIYLHYIYCIKNVYNQRVFQIYLKHENIFVVWNVLFIYLAGIPLKCTQVPLGTSQALRDLRWSLQCCRTKYVILIYCNIPLQFPFYEKKNVFFYTTLRFRQSCRIQ